MHSSKEDAEPIGVFGHHHPFVDTFINSPVGGNGFNGRYSVWLGGNGGVGRVISPWCGKAVGLVGDIGGKAGHEAIGGGRAVPKSNRTELSMEVSSNRVVGSRSRLVENAAKWSVSGVKVRGVCGMANQIFNQMNKLIIHERDIWKHHCDILKYDGRTGWSVVDVEQVLFSKGEARKDGGYILIVSEAGRANGY